MPVQIEARLLSGADRGRRISLLVPGDTYTGDRQIEGELRSISHFGDGSITLVVDCEGRQSVGTEIEPTAVVTLTGQPSPPTADPEYSTDGRYVQEGTR